MRAEPDFGRRAESLAAAFLEAKGYRILGRNVRRGRWEADLVALSGAVLVVVEVKARRGRRWGLPEEAVGRAKARRLVAVGARCLQEVVARGGREGARRPAVRGLRFDVVAVEAGREGAFLVIRHTRDAWRP